MRVVVDSSPLIALARIGRLSILRRLYGTVIRPQSVLDELQAGRHRHDVAGELGSPSWIRTEPDPPEMILRRELGEGETAAITLAFKTQADLVVLDDLQARLVATGLGLRITGTLGILSAAHRAGFLPDLARALTELRGCGFHISDGLIRAMMENTRGKSTLRRKR